MFDVDGFVHDCRGALEEGARASLAVKEILDRALEDPATIEAVLPADRGGFTTLYESPDLTILHLVWPPHVKLFAHDHLMWATIGICGGREDNSFYRRTDDGLEPRGGRSLSARDVLVLGDDAVHSVENPSSSWTGALHVYGGDYYGAPRTSWDAETGVSRPFDVEEAQRVLDAADVAARRTDA